jgi:alkylation response protein AidB-like acyl-CoA dehydrogenase
VFPRATFDEVFSNGPDVIMGGTLAPKGRAEIVDGGYRVSGQAPFASGCQHSSRLVMQCIVTEDGSPKMKPQGGPELRVCLLDKDDVEILDTWYVAGLKGTGSHDIRVEDVFVPEARAVSLFGATTNIDWPGYRIPVLSQFGMSLAACAVGIARGALGDAMEMAVTKRPSFKPGQRVAEDPLARFELGRADTLLRAATALLQSEAEEARRRAESGAAWTDIDRVRMRAAAWQATQFAREIVEIAYTAGGGTSLYDSCSLQRRLRDLHAVTQHAGVSRDVVTWLGGFLLGEPVPDARI